MLQARLARRELLRVPHREAHRVLPDLRGSGVALFVVYVVVLLFVLCVSCFMGFMCLLCLCYVSIVSGVGRGHRTPGVCLRGLSTTAASSRRQVREAMEVEVGHGGGMGRRWEGSACDNNIVYQCTCCVVVSVLYVPIRGGEAKATARARAQGQGQERGGRRLCHIIICYRRISRLPYIT